jgi:o-succinylbenzoate synthase
MKIAGIDWKKYHRNFRTPLSTAKGIVSGRSGILIRVTSNDGISGYGEAAPLPDYSKDSLDDVIAFMQDSSGIVHNITLSDNCDQVFQAIASCIPQTLPSLRFALDSACGDLMARAAGLPLARWLSNDSRSEIPVNYLLTRPVMNWEHHIQAIEAGGYQSVKIKVGSEEVDSDVALIRKAREMLGDDIALRLDANRGWNYDTAIKILKAVQGLRIEYVEEPLNHFDPTLLARLRRETGAKIALDESLAEIDPISPKELAPICDVFILKPTILGGLGRIMKIAAEAALCNRPAVITSTYETEVGLAALIHLAAAIPGKQFACGLNTLRLFDDATDLFGGVQNGMIKIPGKPGLGIEIDW